MAAERTILVVENERVAAREIEHGLRAAGYRVLPIVSSSEAALRAVSEGAPDLVLMDIHLDGDVDGIATTLALRHLSDVPVIYLTGSGDGSSVDRARTTSPYGYLNKPVKPVELRSAVEFALARHARERELRERWIGAVFQCIGDAVIATGTDGTIKFMNRVAETLTLRAERDASSLAIDDVFVVVNETSEEPVKNPIVVALQDRAAVSLATDAVLVRRDGSSIPVDGTAAPVTDGAGDLLGAVLVFRDASERRRLQSNLLVADRMVSMGLLAAGVAHEVNNPLASLIANAEFAAEEALRLEGVIKGAELGELKAALDDIRDGADRIRHTVRDLKLFSRSEEERHVRVDLRGVVESTLRLASNEIRHRARLVKSYGDVPEVDGSESRLGQVFLNLVINAAQAIPEGRAEANEIRVVVDTDPEGRPRVAVTDTGEGMSQEIVSRLFQPFFTTKPAGVGTGLGLSLCKRILDELGGAIAVASEPGHGTTMTVTLPIATSPARATEPAKKQLVEAAQRRGRVLVVDDEPSVATVFRRALARHHDVVGLDRAEAALAAIAGGARFDVIFCDLMMPQMTGMDLYARLNEVAPDQAQRMVFVTGGAFTPRGRQFLDETPNETIEKPFALRQILGLVNARAR